MLVYPRRTPPTETSHVAVGNEKLMIEMISSGERLSSRSYYWIKDFIKRFSEKKKHERCESSYYELIPNEIIRV